MDLPNSPRSRLKKWNLLPAKQKYLPFFTWNLTGGPFKRTVVQTKTPSSSMLVGGYHATFIPLLSPATAGDSVGYQAASPAQVRALREGVDKKDVAVGQNLVLPVNIPILQNRLKWVVRLPQNGTIGFDPQSCEPASGHFSRWF